MLMRLAVLLALCAAAPAAWAGGAYRALLGHGPFPSADEGDRQQAGDLRYMRFVRNRDEPFGSRPDGSGRAGNLVGLSLAESFGGRAGLLADGMALSDQSLGQTFRMSRMDYLLGAAFIDEAWRFQVDREEALPLDQGGPGWRAWDARLSLALGSKGEKPQRGPAKTKTGESRPWRGALTLGWFFHNNTMPTRADGTGLAFLRYAGEFEYRLLSGRLRLSGAADALTDERRRRFAPSGLGLKLGVGVALDRFELFLTRESQDVLDGPGWNAAWLMGTRVSFP
ncbi:MAG TPA: hypothetical protein DCM05_17140 [Elusimicrobia bacterium]|nr:hypothetical protein [Elusimicrobiota bacterium]